MTDATRHFIYEKDGRDVTIQPPEKMSELLILGDAVGLNWIDVANKLGLIKNRNLSTEIALRTIFDEKTFFSAKFGIFNNRKTVIANGERVIVVKRSKLMPIYLKRVLDRAVTKMKKSGIRKLRIVSNGVIAITNNDGFISLMINPIKHGLKWVARPDVTISTIDGVVEIGRWKELESAPGWVKEKLSLMGEFGVSEILEKFSLAFLEVPYLVEMEVS